MAEESPGIVQWFSRGRQDTSGNCLQRTEGGTVESPEDPCCHRNPMVSSGWKVGWFPHERWIDRWIGCFMVPMALVYLVWSKQIKTSTMLVSHWSPMVSPGLGIASQVGSWERKVKDCEQMVRGPKRKPGLVNYHSYWSWPFSSLIYPLNNGGTTIVMVVYRYSFWNVILVVY